MYIIYSRYTVYTDTLRMYKITRNIIIYLKSFLSYKGHGLSYCVLLQKYKKTNSSKVNVYLMMDFTF